MVCDIFLPCFPGYNKTQLELFTAGGSTLADLHQALEDYLPVLLGLTKDGKNIIYVLQNRYLFGSIYIYIYILTCIIFLYVIGSQLQFKVQFNWINQEDEEEVW